MAAAPSAHNSKLAAGSKTKEDKEIEDMLAQLKSS